LRDCFILSSYKMKVVLFLIASLLITFSGFSQKSIDSAKVKSLVIDYYSFADTIEWKKHVAVTHPGLRTDSLLWDFIVDVNVYRSKTRFSRIGISNVKPVSNEIQYDDFFIRKWKVEGYEEIELTKDQMVNRKASIDSINLKNKNGYSINYKYYSLKEGSENIIQCFTNWHVLLYRYAAETNYYVIPYETRPTSPYSSVFPYEKNKLKLAFRIIPLAALAQVEHVDGLRCDLTPIPLEKMDAAILDVLNNGRFEDLLCKNGINYRTVADINVYQKKSTEDKFVTIVTMHEKFLRLLDVLQKRYNKNSKGGVTYVNSYEGATYTKEKNTEGEFCSITMSFKICDRVTTADFIFAKSSSGWILVDINGTF